MKKLSFILIIILSIQVVIASTGNGFNVKYDRISSDQIKLDFNLGEFSIEDINKDGIIYSTIDFVGKVVTNKEGYAELPYISKAIQLSNDRNITVKLNIKEYEDIILDHPLLPSRGVLTRSMDINSIPYEIFESSIKDKWYPNEVTYSVDPYIIRDVRGTSIVVQPFQYNAFKNILRVYKSVTVDITYNDEQPTNPLKQVSNSVELTMNSIYNSIFINYNESKSLEIGDMGEMLIIHTDQNGGLVALEPYIQWKKEKGFTVHTLEVSNGTDLDVATTVKDAYDANTNILYVQLVGDWANLKSKFEYFSVTSSDGCEDPVLGHVVGRDDNYQDVIIGRFSVQSEAELLNQINKAIDYEKNPEIDGAWYTKGLGIASNEGAGMGDDGESDEQHNEIIKNNKLLATTYTDVNTCYQSAGDNGTDIAGYVNDGLTIVNYTGHGYYQSWSNPNITNTGVGNLTNGSKLPVVISVACLVGHLSYGSDCFAEAWLKNENGGAVVGWFSTISQPWLPPMRGQDYFTDLLTGGYNYSVNPGSGTTTTEQRITVGSIAVNAAHLTLAEAPSDVSTIATIKTWTIFGDASLELRTDQPKLIEITNTTIFTGNYTTRVLSAGDPVEGARVTLYQNGENFTALTSTNGEVSIDHSFTNGDVTLTVTGFNLMTSQETLPVVAPDGPYVKINNYSLSSDQFGESVTGTFELKNIGIENSTNVRLTVSTENQHVNFIDNTDNFGDIASSDSTNKAACIAFDINQNTPDQERIEFTTEITDDYAKRSYNSRFYLTVHSPKIDITHSVNGDIINPGESKDVSFRIENNGSADLSDISVELIQTTAFPMTIGESVFVSQLSQGAYTDVVINCSLDGGVPVASSVELTLNISNSDSYSYDYPIIITAGLTDDFETGDFSKNEWVMYGNDWLIDDVEVYSGAYSTKSADINDSQYSEMMLTYEFGANASLSFYRKVSSEANYDYLYLYVGWDVIEKWSGELGWAKYSCDIEPGEHSISWYYEKDNAISNGSDCAWIDNILLSGITTSIDTENGQLPTETKLYNNYPNPFNPSTEIRFFIVEQSNVKLSVFNSAGQVVKKLVDDKLKKGMHLMKFNAGDLNSGVYYYVLETENSKLSEKMLLIK